MLRTFRSLLDRASRRTPAAEAMPEAPDLPRPAHTTYVVGDIHGRADLLELMLELIDAHIGGTGSRNPQLVFVGNYINRGPDSAGVLARLQELTRDYAENVACIMGSHERMLLDFLDDPALRGPRFLREGGDATLARFRIGTGDLGAGASPGAWTEAAERVATALGPETRDWLRDLPLTWSSGNLWAVHAGADPQRAMTAQTARVLLWGHPEFDSSPRGDDLWLAHGHTEVARPTMRDGRIALNTGAWSTGQLTACAIRPDGHHDFLQT